MILIFTQRSEHLHSSKKCTEGISNIRDYIVIIIKRWDRVFSMRNILK